jgi:7,8-dihydro-6-hydroxymethylpterin-pyrophosphokinase
MTHVLITSGRIHLPAPDILEHPFFIAPLFEFPPDLVSLRDSQRAALTMHPTGSAAALDNR